MKKIYEHVEQSQQVIYYLHMEATQNRLGKYCLSIQELDDTLLTCYLSTSILMPILEVGTMRFQR